MPALSALASVAPSGENARAPARHGPGGAGVHDGEDGGAATAAAGGGGRRADNVLAAGAAHPDANTTSHAVRTPERYHARLWPRRKALVPRRLRPIRDRPRRPRSSG